MTVVNASQLFVNPAKNQIGIQSVSECNQHYVANDFVTTAHGVAAYADFGAGRFVARHYSGNGYDPSTADTFMRASEHHTVRQINTSGQTWGLEVGVHTQVDGDGTENVGIDVRASHSGWLPTGVRADVGLRIWGEDGFKFPIQCTHTDMATNLFSVDGAGNTVIGASLSIPELERLQGDVQGVCSLGQDAKLQNVTHKNITFDHNGAGGGTRLIIQKTGVYELTASLLALENNTQAFVHKNGASVTYGVTGAQYTTLPLRYTCPLNAGEYLTIRCGAGSFGNNPVFSHVSMKRIA